MRLAATQFLMSCRHCGDLALHTLLLEHEFAVKYVDAEGYAMTEPATYAVLTCELCSELSLYLKSNLHYPESELGEVAYPVVSVDTDSLPPSIAKAYNDALSVKQKSKVAFLVLGRRVLEEVARDQGVWRGNLARSIETLLSAGKLSPLLADASNLIRAFGNQAAHAGIGTFNEHHVDMADQFLHLLINYLYIAPAQLTMYKHLLDVQQDDA
jgi:hypothetical protein